MARPEIVREQKPTALQQAGGVPGLIYASVPSVVFVVADAVTGLHAAVALAVGAGAGIALLRLLRKESVQPALSGLLGVAIGAFIAYQTGDAKDYFLVGIWVSFVLAVVFLASVLVRRPARRSHLGCAERERPGLARGHVRADGLRRCDARPGGGVRGTIRGAELAVWPGRHRMARVRPDRHGVSAHRGGTRGRRLGGPPASD